MSQLPQIMTQASQEMALSLQKIRMGLSHNLSKGESAEETVRKFLRAYLPSSIGVAHGQIVDSSGQMTKQLDVILYDMTRTPILFNSDEGEHRLVPSEGVFAVVEVKTSVAPSDITGIVEHMTSIKTLNKSAYIPQNGLITHTTQVHGIERDHFPTLYFLFAFEGAELPGVRAELEHQTAARPVDQRVDMACTLSRGVLINHLPNGQVDGVPSDGSTLVSYNTDHALLMFYLLASRYLLQAECRPIALQQYVPSNFVY